MVKDTTMDFHTSSGIVSEKDLKSSKSVLISDKNAAFSLIDPSFPDLWEQLTRGPQVMLPKDIGFIIAKVGINGSFRIVDAGGGSGSLCFSLANICKEITVYETSLDHVSILQKNKSLFGFKNITITQANIYDGIAEKELDLITLDLPEPWKALPHAEKALKAGGFIVAYLPNLTQVQEFISSIRKSNIQVLETMELLERKWKIEDKIMRPEFQMLGHTGFLTFCRKY